MSTTQFLHGIEMVEVQDGSRPITTVRSSVIGLVGTAGKGDVNKGVLIIGNQRDAVAKFGAFKNDGFTIPAALDAIFKQAGAMVVVVNVLDPTNTDNQLAVTSETLTLSGSVGTLAFGFITDDALTFATGSAFARTKLHFPTKPTNNQNVVVGGKTWVFKTTLSSGPAVANEVLIDTATGAAGIAGCFANLLAACNGAAGEGTLYGTGTVASTQVTGQAGPAGYIYFVAQAAGTGGNALASTTTVTSATFSSGTTLSGGTATVTKLTAPYVLQQDGIITLPTGCNIIAVKNSDGDEISYGDLTAGTKVYIDYTAAITEDTDYTLDYEAGTFTRVADKKVLPNATLVASYTKIDASAIVAADIIGGIDDSANYTGMSCLLAARSELFVEPRILIAPGFTHGSAGGGLRNAVAAAFEDISDRLRAVVVLDAGTTTPEAAVAYRENFGKERFYCHYPFFRVACPNSGGVIIQMPGSAFVAGRISATDNDPSKGFWWSPSNQPINGILGTVRPVDFSPSDPNCVANYLSQNDVGCTIFQEGFTLWGNRGCGDTFLCVRRTRDFVQDSIVVSSRWANDRPITRGFVQSVVGSVSEYLRRLVNAGAILGGKAWADPALNTNDVIAGGELFIDFDLTPTYPAEHIVYREHLVNDYVATIFI